MERKHGKILVVSIASILLATSCINTPASSNASSDTPSSDLNSSTIDSSKDSQEIVSSKTSSKEETPASSSSSTEEKKNYIEHHEINKNVKLEYLDYNTPSVGTQPVLILPITFTDKTFTATELDEIKILTGGKAEDTKYWESLGSFYEKSSYGKLKLEFTYADPFSLGVTARSFYSSYSKSQDDIDYGKGAAMAMKKAIDAYKKANGNDSTKKFDTDGDGYIDSVIMIYAENETPSYDSEGDVFWAYRFWDIYSSSGSYLGYAPDGNESSPIGNSYFWSSLNFFYEATGTRNSHTGIDAHTLIHEFGHMLGADDYYNTDSSYSMSLPEPTGAKMMMAHNVLDHDPFNKLQYSWVEPTYVYGDATITISSFEKTGDVLLLTDDNGWNETAFDEYVLVELFTPTGLNELDSKTPYSSMASSGYNNPGVRIWHVDNRLAKISDRTGKAVGYYSDEEVKAGNFGDNYTPYVAAANGDDRDTEVCAGEGFEALSLISSKGKKFTTSSMSTDSDLFHAGDTFSLSQSKYTKYFASNSHLNNGNSFPYTITVDSINSTSATISITRN